MADAIARRGFLAALVGSSLSAEEPVKKFYITGGERATQTDCDVEPIVCYGKNRMDALDHTDITIWTEQEYLEMRRMIGREFDKNCVNRPVKSAKSR